MRILFLNHHGSYIGGAEGYISDVGQALHRAGHTSHLAYFSPTNADRLISPSSYVPVSEWPSLSHQTIAALEEMPAILSQFDVLVFPSHHETLPRIVAEAIASGMMVVGTLKEGAKEILRPDWIGLAFDTEDAGGLAAQIVRLIADSELRWRLAHCGQRAARERVTLERMVDETEAYLHCVAHSRGGGSLP